MLEKLLGRCGKAGYCNLYFPDSVLPPILELHNKNSCSLCLICQLSSPTVYSCSSSLIHAEVFRVPCGWTTELLCKLVWNQGKSCSVTSLLPASNYSKCVRFSGSTAFHESNHSWFALTWQFVEIDTRVMCKRLMSGK